MARTSRSGAETAPSRRKNKSDDQSGFLVTAPTGRTRATGSRERADWDSDSLELPTDVKEELARVAPLSRNRRSDRSLAERLAAAAAAYDRDRYGDAARMTRAVLTMAPGSIAARELYGLACYRQGKWEEAIKHLEIVVASSDDQSQIPVLMDCYRALGRHRKVEDLWNDLKSASPDADVLVEGRLVLASDRAQNKDLKGAIDLLVKAGASRTLRHPAERHIRQWYLLGDLLEASGDIPRAREMFERVVRADPALADAADRLQSLGRPKKRPARSSAASQRSSAPRSLKRPSA
ncbi:MAG: tetratricopeptide repeat protein [Acidimicrobiales bacterium]